MIVETQAIGTVRNGSIPEPRKCVVRIARIDGYAPDTREIYLALQSALAALTPAGQVISVKGRLEQ